MNTHLSHIKTVSHIWLETDSDSSMISASGAVDTLYTVVAREPYRNTGSWVSTQAFTESYKMDKKNPFVLDERFAVPDSNASKHTSTQQTPL